MVKKISVVFGTRPEAIKLCPLIRMLREQPGLETHVCVTGQHRQMLDQVLNVFEIKPDANLALMEPNQTLASLTARAITALDQYLAATAPDMVVVQGDTTTAFCGGLAAFYRRIAVGHVEAGLRTGDKYAPFPEEMNRAMLTRLTDLHFTPTALSAANLKAEAIPVERIFITGNTVIDALHMAVKKVERDPPEVPGLDAGAWRRERMILITGHRRENFGAGFESLCRAIKALALKYPEAAFVYPVHLNPNVRDPVFRVLSGCANVYLIEPLDYLPFVRLMQACYLALTDSGGVQEEAPSLGKPVLVMRETTERPEAVDAGTVELVGTNEARIVSAVSRLMDSEAEYRKMAARINPYGDGHACERIVKILSKHK